MHGDEKISSGRDKFTRFVMMEPSSLKESFKKLGCNQGGIVNILSEVEMSLRISVRVAGMKFFSFGGGAGGKRNGYGESDLKIWCGCVQFCL